MQGGTSIYCGMTADTHSHVSPTELVRTLRFCSPAPQPRVWAR